MKVTRSLFTGLFAASAALLWFWAPQVPNRDEVVRPQLRTRQPAESTRATHHVAAPVILDYSAIGTVDPSVFALGPPIPFPNAREYFQEWHDDLPVNARLTAVPRLKRPIFHRSPLQHLGSVSVPFNRTRHPRAATIDCDVPCHFDRLPHQYAVSSIASVTFDRNTNFFLRMESTTNYPEMQIPVLKLRGSNFVSSYELGSDVPYPYVADFQQLRQRDPLPFNETIKAVTVVLSHCVPHRVKFVSALASRGIPIVSMGACLRNIKLPRDADLPFSLFPDYNGINGKKMSMIRPYALHLAFENSIANDYVTEKVYESLIAGTIPVYRGAPNVASAFVPDPTSIIDTRDFTDIDKLAAYLRAVLTNETLWQHHHAWRTRPPQREYVEKLAPFVKTDFRCRMCRRVYSHIHGIPWDPAAQVLRWPRDARLPQNVTHPPVGRTVARRAVPRGKVAVW